MRSEVQRVAWRAYWPVTLLAVTFLTVVVLFGTYLTARQRDADTRAERQRAAICAILANIPGRIPAEIARARIVFARPGHPADCQPIRRTAKPNPAPKPTPTVTPTVLVLVRPAATPATSPRPTPHPTPTRTPTTHPTPAPSRTCVLIVCIR